MALTRMDLFAIAGVTVLFGLILVVSFFYYFQIPILFGMLFGVLIVLYFILFGLKKSKPDLLNELLKYASYPIVTFALTVGMALLLVITVPNEVVKRLVIAGIAVFACWLMTFPQFIKQELGKRLHEILDTGPAWADPIYTGMGVVLFVTALVLQYLFVDLVS
jgi:hypothetical protein